MASITAPPPVRPPKVPPTRRGGKFYYTIHVHPNKAFTIRLNESAPTAIVGFKNPADALMIGQMIESHYIKQKEWPDITGQLLLPMAHREDLEFLFLQKWDFEDLKMTCTKNYLSMVSVDYIGTTKRGLNFEGKMMTFEAPTEFYVDCLKEMYERVGPAHDL